MKITIDTRVVPEFQALQAQLRATQTKLAQREAELMVLRGGCAKRADCRLHREHSGDCELRDD